MPRDPKITAYISKAAPFARPVLAHLRSVVHAACPQAEEKLKWGFPHFDYNGRMMCSMAAFKEHAVFGFWNAKRMKDPKKVMEQYGSNTAMGNFGRITGIRDLPPKSVLIAYVKEAMTFNEGGAPVRKPATKAATAAQPLRTPPFFLAALRKNVRARRAFDAFPTGQKKEYIAWLTEAKTAETRDKRLALAIEWIAEGKYRNWKYMGKGKG